MVEIKNYILANNLGKILENEPMSNHTYVKTGGKVKFLYEPKSIESLSLVLKQLKKHKIEFFVIGRGSNTLFDDNEINVFLIKISNILDKIVIDEDEVTVGSGYSLQMLSKKVSKCGLEGLEFAGGIPGTVGGAIYMNAGAHTGEMNDVVTLVKTLDHNGEIKEYTKDSCKFSYRESVFQENKEIIIEVQLKLNSADRAKTFKRMSGNLEYRKEMQPLELPSFGSVFKNPDGYHAGKLIEEAGLKGHTIGGVQVSNKHANFFVNVNNATTSDYINLIKHVQEKVKEQKGIDLQTEVIIVKGDNNE
ncbi:MAG: UDP-N-acetylmuramate dehydrogenase [Mycoplasmatales bacterium]